MAVQTLVFVASMGGAVVFTLVGYLFRGLRAPSATQRQADLPRGGSDELQSERQARQQAEASAREARRRLQERERELEDRQAELLKAREKYAESIAQIDEQKTAVQEPETTEPGISAAALQQLEKDAAALRDKLEREAKARQQAEQALTQAKRSGTGQKPGADVERLRKKLDDETERWNKERNDLKAKLDIAQMAQDKAQVQQAELWKQLEQERRELKQLRSKAGAGTGVAEAKLAQSEQTVRQLQAKLKASEAAADADQKARTELEQARDEINQLEAQLRTATETAGGAAAALREEKERLVQQNADLRAKVAELEFKADDTASSFRGLEEARGEIRELKTKLHVSEQKAATADALRDEVVQLRTKVEEAGRQADELQQLVALRKKERELQVKSQMLTQRVEQLQHYADENVALRERLAALESIGESHGAMQTRIKELEAELFASGRAGGRSVMAMDKVKRASGTFTGTMAATLDGQLGRLSSRESCRVAVLADEQGLLLSGSGEEQYFEALAGLAGMIREMAEKTREFLPLGVPRLVEIVDTNDVGLYARLLKMEGGLFSVATLGHRRNVIDETVEKVVAELPAVIAGSASARS